MSHSPLESFRATLHDTTMPAAMLQLGNGPRPLP